MVFARFWALFLGSFGVTWVVFEIVSVGHKHSLWATTQVFVGFWARSVGFGPGFLGFGKNVGYFYQIGLQGSQVIVRLFKVFLGSILG